MKLDIAIIATVRPEILHMTLATFSARLLNQFQVRAFINVDPVGEIDCYTQDDIVQICREYFGEVVANTPASPSFAKAVQWVWQQVETPFYFHLEDDWILKIPVDAKALLQPFTDGAVASVTCNKFDEQTGFNKILNLKMHNEQFARLHCPSFNPCFFRTAYIKELIVRLDINKDPEFQFDGVVNNRIPSNSNPIFLWRIANESLIIDIGHAWRKVNDIHKRGSSETPTYWERKTGPFYKHITADKIRLAFRRRRYRRIKREWKRLYLQNLE